jgi:polyphosphate glucokinase
MIVDGIVEPMELGHLPYKGRTFEHYVGVHGYDRLGRKKWQQAVTDVIGRLIAALEPEDVVVGGGNAKRLKKLPPGCRAGDNANAFLGGFHLWRETSGRTPAKLRSRKLARAVGDQSGTKGAER